jgi:hypothetical protein
MFYTYRYRKRDRQINIDEVLDNLFAGNDYQEPEAGVNAVYRDLSYARYRTIQVDPTRITETQRRYTVRHINKVNQLTETIKLWLLQHQADIVYHEFKIPKATGGFREIKAPGDVLKEFMQEIKIQLEHIGVCPHDSAYAYIKERDCKKALQRHQDHKPNWFLKLDISKFFNNCSPEFIKKQLRLIYPFTLMEDSCYNEFIDSLCGLACLDGELPQGTPLSPLITNWLMVPIDYHINKMLNSLDDNFYTYTRYADDMLISCRHKFDTNEVISLVKALLLEMQTPFEIKDEKTRFGSKAGRNWNLGIMYNKDDNITIGYRRKRRIKTMLFQFFQGHRDYEYVLELNGELAYLKNIEPDYYYGLMQSMNQKYDFHFMQEIKKILRHQV